jgi:hypothetical protein
LYGGWLRQRWTEITSSTIAISLAFLGFEGLMTYTAANAFKRYVERGTIIVNG